MTLGIYHVIIIKAIHAKNSFYMFLKQQIEFFFILVMHARLLKYLVLICNNKIIKSKIIMNEYINLVGMTNYLCCT